MKPLFAQITKVDQANRLVYGVAALEQMDRSGEVMDYEQSKPFFEAWSKSQHEASMGKSFGNVRAMHGKTAAGVLCEPIQFVDEGKAVQVCAKVVDDNEWKKAIEGVYTGFSIGGSYAKKWDDPTMKKDDGQPAMRYVAKPSEVSLVDRPCMPGATFFEIKKADGSMEKVEFAARTDEQLTDSYYVELGLWKNEDACELAKREFSDEQRKKMADKGTAMKDGSYPIANKGDLKNAIDAIGRAKDPEATKAHIKSRAKALNAEDMLPEDWGKMAKSSESPDVIALSAKAKDTSAVANKEGTGEMHMKAAEAHSKAATAHQDAGNFKMAAAHLESADAHTVKAKAAQSAEEQQKADGTLEVDGSEADLIALSKTMREQKLSVGQVHEIVRSTTDRAAVMAKAKAALKDGKLKKDFYTVAMLAQFISQFEQLCQSVDYEEMREGDGSSTLPAKCDEVCNALCELLTDMVAEESAEYAEGEGDEMEMADFFAPLTKIRAARKEQLAKLESGELKKETVAAQQARHAQAIHDLALEVGAQCGGEDDAEKLAKLAEGDALQKIVSAAVEKATAPLTEKIARLEAQPMPGGIRLRVITKADDSSTTTTTADPKVEPVLGKDGSENEVATLIKATHLAGGHRVY